MSSVDTDEGRGESVLPKDATTLFIPECEVSLKPIVESMFSNIEEAEQFYRDYASLCGFKTRKSTIARANDKDGTILTRYMLCNREGQREDKSEQIVGEEDDEKQKRMRLSSRVECMARVVFKRVSGGHYRVKFFAEGHTHPMVNPDYRYLMTSNRKVDQVHQLFLLTGIKANIGPMRMFRFFKELVGGYDQVGCIGNDFKNYARDLRASVVGVDAHMLLENFKDKQKKCPGFKYFFHVCEDNQLKRLFWADQTAVRNFNLFGDAVSFDATYNTNRYKMIFTPFTGKDNHGACVSFGAAVISNEDEESYKWVLERFVDCMGSQPSVLTTDQDPALKKAVAAVLPNTSHRFCMWHILMKVAEKLPSALSHDSDFKTRFDKIAWSDIDEVETFEQKWCQLMAEFNLTEHRWFSDIFEARRFWVPAFFRDTKMSGIFRTTSASESENSFFKRFLNKNSDLVRLYMSYSSAINAQRSTYDLHEMADANGDPDRRTKLSIERHAATIYSYKKFKEVQKEIVQSVDGCVTFDTSLDGFNKIYHVKDSSAAAFDVYHKIVEDYIECNCKLFTRKGFPCRHIFLVMRTLNLQLIPDKYIVKRWTKSLMQSTDEATNQGIAAKDGCSPVGNNRFLVELCKCMTTANGNKVLEDLLYSGLQNLGQTLVEASSGEIVAHSKQTSFEQFYGAKIPKKPDVKSPDLCKNKGSGAGGRKKSEAEKAIILAKKPKRKCANCLEVGHHDSRNCPKKSVED